MNDRERFLAICKGQEPDYYPIFGFPGAPGMSRGCMTKTHLRLVETGMPTRVGGKHSLVSGLKDVESWKHYWGTTDPITCGLKRTFGAPGIKMNKRTEGAFEILEYESGAVTKQVIDNDVTYSMPDFVEYAVRDRASWEFWKERMSPTEKMPLGELNELLKPFAHRKRPLLINVSGAYGFLRGLMGPERLSMMFYDDPDLIHEMMAWQLNRIKHGIFPVIEAVRPEIIVMGEDLCFNHGMLLSPTMFHEFFGSYYREVSDCAISSGTQLIAVDTDGNLMEYAGVATSYGVNGLFPCEVKAGNDLLALRKKFPKLVLFGWLEKETVNEGNGFFIKNEIMGKVPPLLKTGRYFPNGDHGIQPDVTFENLCRFMTILHDVCRNPEGEFPRI